MSLRSAERAVKRGLTAANEDDADRRATDTRIEPTVVIVPGLRDHVPDHWQTLLAARLPNARTVPRMTPASATKLSCDAWVDMLDCSLATIDAPVVLVAHSAGAVIVAHWAKRHRRAITGALLATPADVERPLGAGYPTTETLEHNGWLPIPREPLPFPSIVAASSNDPLGGFDRIVDLARAWGSRVVNIGAVGHLNPGSGYGEWPFAEILVDLLVAGDIP